MTLLVDPTNPYSTMVPVGLRLFLVPALLFFVPPLLWAGLLAEARFGGRRQAVGALLALLLVAGAREAAACRPAMEPELVDHIPAEGATQVPMNATVAMWFEWAGVPEIAVTVDGRPWDGETQVVYDEQRTTSRPSVHLWTPTAHFPAGASVMVGITTRARSGPHEQEFSFRTGAGVVGGARAPKLQLSGMKGSEQRRNDSCSQPQRTVFGSVAGTAPGERWALLGSGKSFVAAASQANWTTTGQPGGACFTAATVGVEGLSPRSNEVCLEDPSAASDAAPPEVESPGMCGWASLGVALVPLGLLRRRAKRQ